MKTYTTEDFEAMTIKQAEEYYKKLHEENRNATL